MKDNNKTVWIVLGIIILIIAVMLIVKNKNKDGEMNDDGQNTDVTTVEPSEDVSEGSVTATTPGSTPVTLSYANALIQYADRRIQINDACQATPTNMTFKTNTNIMIDNRSAQTKVVKIGSTYTVKGYGFKIIKLTAATPPLTLLMDCGAQQNVATILIQK